MLTLSQQRVVGMVLSPRTGELPGAPFHTLPLSRRRLAFLIDAIGAYHDSRCPQRGGTEGCQLLSWYESPATGALETVCGGSCLAWRDELIDQLAHAAGLEPPAPDGDRAPAVPSARSRAETARFIPAD
jgi:hypothetical protein